ncbi:MAG TPA: hypothetical protein DD979_07095 [Gammaproteobacteria bacterium]|nr:hypothetical protein [Gammaproteobacteria bacterium]
MLGTIWNLILKPTTYSGWKTNGGRGSYTNCLCRIKAYASIARDADVSRQAVWQALVKPYPRAEKIIAQTLGLTPQILFPERYDSDGLPNRKRGRPIK